MGDRSSISFLGSDGESVALFHHWGGTGLFDVARQYASELAEDILNEEGKEVAKLGHLVGWPLGRLEANTAMVDFMRWLVQKNEIHAETRVSSSWYFGKDDSDGDNSDNGHRAIDLVSAYNVAKAIRERSALVTATTATKAAKPKKTPAEWKAAKEMAAKITGYGDTSPIWGKTDVTVFSEISAYLKDAKDGTGLFHLPLEASILLIDELQKREAFKRLAATL